jgi:hypothetical protein
MLYDLLLTADHQAISALEAEHAVLSEEVEVRRRPVSRR